MPDPLQDPVMIEKKREKRETLSVIQIHYHFPTRHRFRRDWDIEREFWSVELILILVFLYANKYLRYILQHLHTHTHTHARTHTHTHTHTHLRWSLIWFIGLIGGSSPSITCFCSGWGAGKSEMEFQHKKWEVVWPPHPAVPQSACVLYTLQLERRWGLVAMIFNFFWPLPCRFGSSVPECWARNEMSSFCSCLHHCQTMLILMSMFSERTYNMATVT